MSKPNQQIITDIQGQVRAQMATLSTRIPQYDELTDEQKAIVDAYIKTIDLSNPETIDEFGRKETERIYEDLNVLIGTMKTHDTSIGDMFTELMMSLNGPQESKESFIALLRKSPREALVTLKNRPKQMIEAERFRRAKVLTNIDVVQEKLESIRCELRVNAGKLESMAQNSAEQYRNVQYQIIALDEISRQIQEQQYGQTAIAERTLEQISEDLRVSSLLQRIQRKKENAQGVIINAATKAIMARLLAIHNENLASSYDQDLSSLLPELKGILVTAQANDSLIQAVDTHNQFISTMNDMLRTESERSREAIEKVQEISTGSAIDAETAKTLTANVLSVVKTLKAKQEEGRPVNDAFAKIMTDFRQQLSEAVSSPTPQLSTDDDVER